MTSLMDAGTRRAFQIGEVAERTGLSQRTIRHYDDLGLIKPSARTTGGFRIYTESDVERFLMIKPLKPLGLGLDVVRRLLGALAALEADPTDPAARAEATQLHELIRSRQEETREAILAVERTTTALEGFIGR